MVGFDDFKDVGRNVISPVGTAEGALEMAEVGNALGVIVGFCVGI